MLRFWKRSFLVFLQLFLLIIITVWNKPSWRIIIFSPVNEWCAIAFVSPFYFVELFVLSSALGNLERTYFWNLPFTNVIEYRFRKNCAKSGLATYISGQNLHKFFWGIVMISRLFETIFYEGKMTLESVLHETLVLGIDITFWKRNERRSLETIAEKSNFVKFFK